MWTKEQPLSLRVLGYLEFLPLGIFIPLAIFGLFEAGVITGLVLQAILTPILIRYGRLKTLNIVFLGFFLIYTVILFALPAYARIPKEYFGAFLWGVLLIMALTSLLIKRPFTLQHAKETTIDAIWNEPSFISTNVILTCVFLAVFLVNTTITVIWHASFVPHLIAPALLILAFISTMVFPSYYVPYYLKKHGAPLVAPGREFTVREIFEGMPAAFDPEKAKGWNAVIQFHISGEQGGKWHLRVENQECTISEGEAKDPTTTVFTDAKTWIGVSRGRLAGAEAFMTGKMRAEGDLSALLKIEQVFGRAE